MTGTKTRGRQIHVEMPSDEYDLFKALAKEQDLSLQQLVRRCIRAHIEHGDAYKDTHPNLKIVTDETYSGDEGMPPDSLTRLRDNLQGISKRISTVLEQMAISGVSLNETRHLIEYLEAQLDCSPEQQ
ncbi:hypothetical protein [Burkholderia vietnamiensis]|uniref:hypothetical protein n=1 Tax=Burkholderia vietnamiensis TaxID=60552 RepID=UPI002010EF22|nr:hypothetical protein [Burkholderia vietnamiensis]